MRHITPSSLGLAVLCLGTHLTWCTSSHAQWTVTNLHPSDSTGESKALATSSGQHAGYVTIGGRGRAALWNGTANTWTDLTPPGAQSAYISASDNHQQVGYAYGGGNFGFAVLWNDTRDSWVGLGPFGSQGSYVHDVHSGIQVVEVRIGGLSHAGMWTGSQSSWIDLNSSSFEDSVAYGVSANQQVGIARFNATGGYTAVLWEGTASSWISLHPQGAAESAAVDVEDGMQVGWAWIGGRSQAGCWRGSANTWTNLNPVGAWSSAITSTHTGCHVGYAEIDGRQRAGIWRGAAGTWEDLSVFLPTSWGHSRAESVWSDSTTTYVAGYGFNTEANRNEALLWTRPVSPFCFADIDDGSGAGVPNGAVDVNDLLYFLGVFEEGSANADLDNGSGDGIPDGGVDIRDLLFFLEHFELGC